MRKLILQMTVGGMSCVLLLSSCNQENAVVIAPNHENGTEISTGHENIMVNSAVMKKARSGSSEDIERIIRYYEECARDIPRDECRRRSEYWAEIGAEYGLVGAMTIIINRDISSNDCKVVIRTNKYLERVIENNKKFTRDHQYDWKFERDLISDKLKRC